MTNHSHLLAQQLKQICPDLAQHIARCTEQAYRRGYQQGAIYGKDLDKQIVRWRFDPPADFDWDNQAPSERYNDAPAPPDRRDLGLHPDLQKPPKGHSYGYSCSSVERLSFEAGNCSELISALAYLDA